MGLLYWQTAFIWINSVAVRTIDMQHDASIYNYRTCYLQQLNNINQIVFTLVAAIRFVEMSFWCRLERVFTGFLYILLVGIIIT